MSAGAILRLGYGPGGSSGRVLTLGYGGQDAVVVPDPVPTPVGGRAHRPELIHARGSVRVELRLRVSVYGRKVSEQDPAEVLAAFLIISNL